MRNPIDRMKDMTAWLRSINQESRAQEMEEYARLMEIYSNVFRHSFAADKVGDIYFICGESGEKDVNNLPTYIHICPAYGVDWFQLYQKIETTHSTEW